MENKIPEKCRMCVNLDGESGDHYCSAGVWGLAVTVEAIVNIVSGCPFFSPK